MLEVMKAIKDEHVFQDFFGGSAIVILGAGKRSRGLSVATIKCSSARCSVILVVSVAIPQHVSE